MIILEDWQSGSEYNALRKAEMLSESLVQNENNLYKFDNNGLHLDQGKIETVPVSYLSSVTAIAEHGFVYVASREFYLYAKKEVLLANPTEVVTLDDVPEYIKVALGYGLVSGVPSSIPVSVFSVSGIPTYDTPIVISRVFSNRWERPMVLTPYNTVNGVNRKKLNFLPGRRTGIEEPLTEVYQNDKLRSIHKDEDVIIRPDKYIFDPFTFNIYVTEYLPEALIEYETTLDRKVTLGDNFAASSVGKQSGLLALVSSEIGSKEASGVGVGKRVISLSGSSIYIALPEGTEAYVEPRTEYIKDDGKYLDYSAIANNLEYVEIISNEDYTGPIYTTTGQRVGYIEPYSVAILPIVAYLDDGIHTPYLIDKGRGFTIVPTESGLISSEFSILVRDSLTSVVISEERILVNKRLSSVSVGELAETTAFVPAGEDIVSVRRVADTSDMRVRAIKDVYKLDREDGEILSVEISESDPYGVDVEVNPLDSGGVIIFKTYTHRIVNKEGGDLYGV